MNRTTYLPKLGGLALVAGALAFSSCQKEDEEMCGGAPSITQVSKPTNRTEATASGNLADWIIIRGSNFCNVQQVLLNDVEASLKDAYITPDEITLRIPRTVPKDVTNKITVVAAAGSAETSYKVTIPPLVISSMTNEYAAPGEKIAIVGQNFDLYEVAPGKGKVLFGGTAAAIIRHTADSIYFLVPASATKGMTLKVVDGNNTEHKVAWQYKDERNMIFSYDTGGSVWGADTYITDAATPGPISGKYLRVNTTIGAWAWTEFSATNTALPSDVVTNPANYVLKFEINTRKPFNANVMKLAIGGDPGATVPVNTYVWTSATAFSTQGKWRTMAINLSDFMKKPLDPAKSQHEIKFLFHGDGALDADISFDNVRIVPKS